MAKCEDEKYITKSRDKEDDGMYGMSKVIFTKPMDASEGSWTVFRDMSKYSGTWFYCFVIIGFIFLAVAMAFLYASITVLECKLQLVQEALKSKLQFQEELVQLLQVSGMSVRVKRDGSFRGQSSLSQYSMRDERGGEERVHAQKRKREISSGYENAATERVPTGKSLSTLSFNDEYSLEYLSSNHSDRPGRTSYSSTTPKTRRSRRKPKKYHRHHVSAEKFFTETESTTSTPIQVRQSRTKQTENSGEKDRKHKQALHHKPLLQVFASKESITREEALRRQFASRNLIPENVALFSKSGNDTVPDAPARLVDTITYNMIIIHYAADTTHYSRERDLHYFGNGRMQMKTSVYKDWKPIHWTHGIQVTKYFNLNQGVVTVSLTGIYLIYAQVQYSNIQEVNGYSVVRNKQVIVQCITTSIHPDKDEVKSNTCDTSTTILLHENDRISLQDLHHGRHVVLTPEKSYFGLILLSPFKGN